MCCIHNLHERLSIIFIQSINLLVFPLPPRFLSSSSDFLLPFPPLCLLLPQFLSSPSQKDHSRMPWAVRLKKVCEVTGIQNARTPTSAGKGITFVCSGNQAGRQAYRCWENPQCSFILLCCLFLTLLALSASLYRNSGTEAPPPSQWFQPMINCKDTRLPSFHHPPTPPRSFFFPWCQCFS